MRPLSSCRAAVVMVAPSLLLAAPLAQPALADAPAVAQPTTPDNAPFPGIPLPPVPEKFLNKWPEAEERAFQERAKTLLAYFAQNKPGQYGGTYFENEKRSYPLAMLDFLNGHRAPALAFLQGEDADAKSWNTVTDGIDLFPGFTLKHQGRKYFLFGPYLDPTYRERMKNAAKTWTTVDPLMRPHPYFKGNGEGWTPEYKNSWVDVRNTDNLRAMREVNVYLFAEETGNEAVRQLYKGRLNAAVRRLYEVGPGEWDSENYTGHSTASYLNLYDFAKDDEVRALAKAALDWVSVESALDYYRGGWAAPSKRDYGGANRVFGSLAPRFFQIYFGDNPLPNPQPEPDVVHAMTSRYRPPLAAMALARREFARPVEMLQAKPAYDNWSATQAPQSYRTMFYGQSFQMGSVVSPDAIDDVGPFKVGAYSTARGVDFFLANTVPAVGHQSKEPGDQIGQSRNLLLWLRPAGTPAANKPFYFMLPRDANLEKEDGIWFWKMEKTWLALRPINLGEMSEVPIQREEQEKNQPARLVPDEAFKDVIEWTAASVGDSYAGFALEVGEGNYDEWKRAVKAKGALDVTRLKDGVAQLTGSDGHTLRLTHNQTNNLPLVECDGSPRQWDKANAVYQAWDKGNQPSAAPVAQTWGGGELRVEAGGYRFTSGFNAAGKVMWSEKATK